MCAFLLIECFDVAAEPNPPAKAAKQKSEINHSDIDLIHTDHAVRLLAGHKAEVI